MGGGEARSSVVAFNALFSKEETDNRGIVKLTAWNCCTKERSRKVESLFFAASHQSYIRSYVQLSQMQSFQ